MTDENAPAENAPVEPAMPSMPSSQPVLLRALRIEVGATILLAIAFGALGYLVSASPGLIGGALGAGIAGLMSCLTIGSIAFANQRFIKDPNFVAIFFGIVAGGWLLKLVIFVVLLILLKQQSWLDPRFFFFGLVAGVVASLVIDVLVIVRSRLPYVDAQGV